MDRTSLEHRHPDGTVRLSAESSSPRVYVPPRPLAVWAFERYFRSLFARHFTTVRWTTLTETAGWDREVPTLLVANHTNWWDGLFAFLIGNVLGLTFHILMDAAELARYPPFRWVGVLPIRRGHLRGAYDDLHRAVSCLRPSAGLWIFPQGSRRPSAEALGGLTRGAAQLALAYRGPVRVVPVAFRYVFVSEQLPEAFALVGRPRVFEAEPGADRRVLTSRIEGDMVETLGALDALLADEALGSFRMLVAGRRSVNKRMDRLRHAVGLLRGPFEARNG